MGDTSPSGTRGGTGNATENIPNASKDAGKGGASGLSWILLKCIPATQSVRRVASSDRLKKAKSLTKAKFISFDYFPSV